MRKYDKFHSTIDIRRAIANELAEINRIERLKLKIELKSEDVCYDSKLSDKPFIDKDKIDLEDKA